MGRGDVRISQMLYTTYVNDGQLMSENVNPSRKNIGNEGNVIMAAYTPEILVAFHQWIHGNIVQLGPLVGVTALT